jgi:predicted RNase H-like HicB family nuclease
VSLRFTAAVRPANYFASSVYFKFAGPEKMPQREQVGVESGNEGSRGHSDVGAGRLGFGDYRRQPPPVQASCQTRAGYGQWRTRRRHAERYACLGPASVRPERSKTLRRTQYLVRINRDAGSDWGASVPDLPGCVATGKTLETAIRRIQGAIELHLAGLRADGLPVPKPRQRAVIPRRTKREINFYATVEVAA